MPMLKKDATRVICMQLLNSHFAPCGFFFVILLYRMLPIHAVCFWFLLCWLEPCYEQNCSQDKYSKFNSDLISLTTSNASVGFLASMANLVLQEFPLCVKGFPALVASEHFVCGMGPFVFFQIAHVVEACENKSKNSSKMTKKSFSRLQI